MKVIPIHQEEKQIIDLAIANNRQAQKQIYDQFSPKMLGVCRNYISDIHHAEDILLTGFMKVFSNLKKFEHKGSFEGWIRRIMIYECIDFIRAKKNHIVHQNNEDFIVSEKESSYEMEDFAIDDIQYLIDNLPDGFKMVFNLYAIEGFKHHEIATMLKISEGTSKSQLSHARKLLQHQLFELKKRLNGTK